MSYRNEQLRDWATWKCIYSQAFPCPLHCDKQFYKRRNYFWHNSKSSRSINATVRGNCARDSPDANIIFIQQHSCYFKSYFYKYHFNVSSISFEITIFVHTYLNKYMHPLKRAFMLMCGRFENTVLKKSLSASQTEEFIQASDYTFSLWCPWNGIFLINSVH